jgi:hypothetical protein
MEEIMTSSNPCAVYNFYNCCGHTNGSSSSQSAPFIWHSGSILDPQAASTTATTEPLASVFSLGNSPNAALKAYMGLTPLHRKAQLQEIMLLRFPEATFGPPYTGSVNLDLVVLDYAGAVIRQLSTVALNYKTIPLKTWTPMTLSTVASALDILPGEIVAGQLTFGTAVPSGTQFVAFYHLSGTGILF